MKSKTSKILAGMLTVGLCLSLSACGAKQEEPKQSKANETTQQTESVRIYCKKSRHIQISLPWLRAYSS